MNLTENEKSILNIIATDELNALNGSIPRTQEESATWLFLDQVAEDAGMTMNQAKGVIGSLTKKEIISVDQDDLEGGESMVQITKEGLDFLWQ